MGLKWVNTPKEKKKRQYTKLVMDLVLWLTLVTTLASIYINFKNGMGLDGIVANCWDGLKYIVPSYCAKSFFETREENKNQVRQREDDVEC